MRRTELGRYQGLFTGTEFAEKGSVPVVPQIILLLNHQWDLAQSDKKSFRGEMKATFMHELGHYLGSDEKELAERGLE